MISVGIKILVVDDEKDVREMTQRKLERVGFTVFQAANGKEALALTQKEMPDLIVLDVVMPEMDGFAFFKEIRKHPDTSGIPVIVLTARSQMEDTFLAMGSQDFLPKPFESDALLLKIEQVLEKQITAARPKTSVLILGLETAFLDKTSRFLTPEGFNADYTTIGKELLIKALRLKPESIFLDVLVDDIPAHEIIKALRSLSMFRAVSFLVYSCLNYGEQNVGFSEEKHTLIENEKIACMKAGANYDLGYVTESSFQDLVLKHLNGQK